MSKFSTADLWFFLNTVQKFSMQDFVKAKAAYMSGIATHICHRALQDSIGQLRNPKDKMIICFLYISSGFDTINRSFIQAVLVSLNVPMNMIDSLMFRYSSTREK